MNTYRLNVSGHTWDWTQSYFIAKHVFEAETDEDAIRIATELESERSQAIWTDWKTQYGVNRIVPFATRKVRDNEYIEAELYKDVDTEEERIEAEIQRKFREEIQVGDMVTLYDGMPGYVEEIQEDGWYIVSDDHGGEHQIHQDSIMA